MNDDHRIQLARATGDRMVMLASALGAHAAIDGSTVIGRMRDLQGPLRAKSYDAERRSFRADATPAAARAADQAVADERELNRCITQASVAVAQAWRILGRYPAPRRPNPAEQAAVGRLNGRGEMVCQSCARTTDGTGAPRCEPVRADLSGPTTVGDRLHEALALCRWCYGCVRDWNRLPTPEELSVHHRGGRVPWPADVPRPA